MSKRWSLFLGTWAGVKVFIHWTFVILLGWIFISYYRQNQELMDGVWGVLYILSLFLCVTLHEFGHVLTARRYGIATRDITLYPIGGVASLEAMPEKPAQELLVAAAGPAVNVVIAFLLYVYLSATGFLPAPEILTDPALVEQLPFAYSVMLANILLVVFNLIPAFPMDGGRMLRALLGFRMTRARATKIAASIGQLLAIGFVFLGFFFNFWLVFIGFFIYLGAGGEAAYEETRSALAGYKVRDVLMTRFHILHPTDELTKVVRLLLEGQDQEFVVVENGEVQGVLTRRDLIKGLDENGRSASVASAMQTDFKVLTPDMNLEEVFKDIALRQDTVFPVLEDGSLIGLVNRENINELLMINSALNKANGKSPVSYLRSVR